MNIKSLVAQVVDIDGSTLFTLNYQIIKEVKNYEYEGKWLFYILLIYDVIGRKLLPFIYLNFKF